MLGADCRRAEPPRDPEARAVVQPMGAWNGTGNHTIGLVSNSGRFRIRWTVAAGDRGATGTFRLTVHSAVSGRPLQQIVDLRGPGEGTINFEDDPRPYNLMVESEGLAWSIAVDEMLLVAPASPPGR